MTSTISSISSATDSSSLQANYIQLLIAQLRDQDPTNPVDNNQMVAQLATFSQLQQMESMNGTFGQILQLQELGQGQSLLGKEITYVSAADGTQRSGLVQNLKVQNGQALLQVGSDMVGLDDVQSVNGQSVG